MFHVERGAWETQCSTWSMKSAKKDFHIWEWK